MGEAGQRISTLEAENRESKSAILGLKEKCDLSDVRIFELEGSVVALEQQRDDLLLERDNTMALIERWENTAAEYMDSRWNTCMRQLEILHPYIDRRGFSLGADIVDDRLVYPPSENPFDDDIFIDVGDDNKGDGGGDAGEE